jgi:hypothetical protein
VGHLQGVDNAFLLVPTVARFDSGEMRTYQPQLTVFLTVRKFGQVPIGRETVHVGTKTHLSGKRVKDLLKLRLDILKKNFSNLRSCFPADPNENACWISVSTPRGISKS